MKTMTYHCLKQCESLYYEVNCLNISFLMTNENNVVFSDKIKKKKVKLFLDLKMTNKPAWM